MTDLEAKLVCDPQGAAFTVAGPFNAAAEGRPPRSIAAQRLLLEA